jgi:hypothetical protein
MRSRGYSLAEVAALLGEQGLAVTEAVLKVYLRRARQRTSHTSTPKKPRSAARADHPEAGAGNRPVGGSADRTNLLSLNASPLGHAASNAPEKDLGTEPSARHGNEAATHKGPGGTDPEEGGKTTNVAYPGTPSVPAAPPIDRSAALSKDARSNTGADGSLPSTLSGRFVPRVDTEDL